MTRPTRPTRIAALSSALLFLLAACGGDDDPEGSNTTEAASAPSDADTEATAAPDATTTATDGGSESGSAPAGSDAPADEGDAGAACDATVAGSQIDYGIFVPNAAFDPVGSSGALVGGTEVAAVYDVLFIFDPTTGETVPHLAESLEPDNDEFTEWTLKLREGITYSDGTALTAQLVSDNIDRYFAEDGVRNTSAGFLQYIEEREIVDDTTMRMTLNTPVAELGLFFADEPGMVVNTNAIGDDIDAFRAMPPDAAGLGPYVVERNIPGEETVMKARTDYWGGPVCVETLRFVWIPGASPTYDAFKNGELDVAFVRDPIVNQQAIDDGVEHFYFNQDGGAMHNFNHREGHITADPRIREAISLAIDPQVVSDRAYQGKLTTTKAYFGEDSRYFSDAIDALPIDVERAKQLVEEVKAEGWDGSLTYVAGNDTGDDAPLAVEGMLNSIGITTNTELMPTTESIGRLHTGEFDLITNGFNSGPGTAVLSLVRNLSSTSPTNRMGYASDAMDELLDTALATPFADLPPVMAEINDQINADFAAPTHGTTSEGIVWADNVSGIVPTVSTIFLFHDAVIEE